MIMSGSFGSFYNHFISNFFLTFVTKHNLIFKNKSSFFINKSFFIPMHKLTIRAFYLILTFLDNAWESVSACLATKFIFFVFCFEIFKNKIFKFSEFSFMDFLIFIKEISTTYVFGFTPWTNPSVIVGICLWNADKIQVFHILTTYLEDY